MSHELAMRELAKKTGLQFDGGDDYRLFVDDEQIRVFAFFMSEDQYDRMEEEIDDLNIQGDGYSVYAWNDVSGYKYWSSDEQAYTLGRLG